MKITTKKTDVRIARETGTFENELMKVGTGIGIVAAALAGLWGAVCLIGGLAGSTGIGEVVRSYLTAVCG